MTVICIIQARMGATRLPGKMLLDIGGKPLLTHVVEQVAKAKKLSHVIVATSTHERDDPIAVLAKDAGVECVRGSEDDVLSRFMQALQGKDAAHVVRLCADQAFNDPGFIDEVIAKHEQAGVDYTSTALERTFPIGYDVEVVKHDVLEKVDTLAKDAADREHVTKFIVDRPKEFTQQNIEAPAGLKRPDIKLTVDTDQDLRFVREIWDALGSNHTPTIKDVIAVLDAHPEIKQHPLVAIRADGSEQLGMGHISGMLQLAQAMREKHGAACVFLTRENDDVKRVVEAAGHAFHALPKEMTPEEEEQTILDLVSNLRPSAYVTDLLTFPHNYMDKLRALNIKTLCNDVLATTQLAPDAMVNRDFLPQRLDKYDRHDCTTYYTGLKYTIINPAYSDTEREPIQEQPKRLLITMGGSDPMNLSDTAIQAAIATGIDWEITVVLGPAYKQELSAAKKAKDARLRIVKNLPVLAPVMLDADLAIASGGLTLFELAATGTPALILCQEPEQIINAEGFAEKGTCRTLGWGDKVSVEEISAAVKDLANDLAVRQKMSETGRSLVDGRGAERVADILGKLLQK